MTTAHEGNVKLTLPFDAIDRAMLPIAGGKVANLGELARAELAGAPGLLRDNYNLELVAEDTGLNPILDNLAKTRPDDTARLAERAAAACVALRRSVRAEDAPVSRDLPPAEAPKSTSGRMSSKPLCSVHRTAARSAPTGR